MPEKQLKKKNPEKELVGEKTQNKLLKLCNNEEGKTKWLIRDSKKLIDQVLAGKLTLSEFDVKFHKLLWDTVGAAIKDTTRYKFWYYFWPIKGQKLKKQPVPGSWTGYDKGKDIPSQEVASIFTKIRVKIYKAKQIILYALGSEITKSTFHNRLL